jgi:hypothetical protein
MKPEPMPEQPIKWLLSQLAQLYRDDIISLDTYERIMAGYDTAKQRYDTASKLRLARQELAMFRRNQSQYEAGSTRYQSYAVKISRRIERIKKLEGELEQ